MFIVFATLSYANVAAQMRPKVNHIGADKLHLSSAPKTVCARAPLAIASAAAAELAQLIVCLRAGRRSSRALRAARQTGRQMRMQMDLPKAGRRLLQRRQAGRAPAIALARRP